MGERAAHIRATHDSRGYARVYRSCSTASPPIPTRSRSCLVSGELPRARAAAGALAPGSSALAFGRGGRTPGRARAEIPDSLEADVERSNAEWPACKATSPVMWRG